MLESDGSEWHTEETHPCTLHQPRAKGSFLCPPGRPQTAPSPVRQVGPGASAHTEAALRVLNPGGRGPFHGGKTLQVS